MTSPVPKSTDPREGGVGVIILGMHRSGTSLSSRLFGALGCSHGGPLMPAKEDNAEGFWEHQEIVQIHDDFLSDSLRTWSDPRPWRTEDFTSPAAERARARLADVFTRDFEHRPLWVLKDPRISRLLPLWKDVLERSGHRITFFHTARHPLAVARSLEARNGFDRDASLLLWLRHVLEAEQFTRGADRAWVAFEDLAADPVGQLRSACGRMGIAKLFDFAAVEAEVSRSVRPQQIHHQIEDQTLPDWPWVRATRRAVLGLVHRDFELGSESVMESESSHRALDAVRQEVADVDAGPYASAMRSLLGYELDEQHRRAQQLAALEVEARSHLEKLDRELEESRLEIERGLQHTAKLDRELDESRREIERGSQYAAKLESEITQARSYQDSLLAEIEKAKGYQKGLEAELEAAVERVRQLEASREEDRGEA